MELQPAARYASELKSILPKRFFEPARSRLLWLPFHLTLITLCAAAITLGWVGPWQRLLLVPVIGFSFAGITFVAHETLHGAIVRGRRAQRVVGWIGFLPFLVSPRLWLRWHNQVHHGNANKPGADPDAFPTLEQYKKNGPERWVVDGFSVGSRRLRGILTLVLGFTFHSAHMLLTARKRELLSPSEQRTALLETGLGALFWGGVLSLVGPTAFVFIYLLPLMIANSIVMAYILTNHSLSPQTAVNDPLINSLSVTVPRFVEWLTLHFGYHVEHHIFPWMSTRHARQVRALLQQRWPERYQSMPLFSALLCLHRTPRVYKNDTTLVDPNTGIEWQTLLPNKHRPSAAH